MVPAHGVPNHPKIAILMIMLLSSLLLAQDPQGSKFYDVQVSKDEIYEYTNLNFTGDFTSFDSPKGFLALCNTAEGVTVVMILSEGSLTIQAPEQVQEKFKEILGAHPVKTTFKTLFMRLHPKEYGETIGKISLNKVSNEAAFKAANELFADSFMRIPYHAGAKAILPPYRTRVMEFVTPDHGKVWNEEGYWLVLRKYAPYGSVYPRDFVNPKQK